MSPFMSRDMALEHMAAVRREVARSRRSSSKKENESEFLDGRLTVRRFQERDIDGIRRLAELDGKRAPSGPVLVAEVEGQLVAALPLDGGHALADPFRPSATIVELLRLRAAQLKGRRPARRLRLPAWRPRVA